MKLLLIVFAIATMQAHSQYSNGVNNVTTVNNDTFSLAISNGDYYKCNSGYVNIKDATLIADETTLTYTKTGAKVVTFSESVFQAISLKWGDEFKSINIKYKKDRHGQYKEYVIYMSQEVANNIRQWSKKNL